ncbi:glutaminase [Desmospora profundinema]|uniref:Glutaminase n=1 Tax=Desmospora profundinema TaxID=1571184 RepID=A0ABU1INH2_9BACL|nr:glutaminase [Desmospora profundinema]MDR6226332.1 glutaminase [Desmospora profundinema]
MKDYSLTQVECEWTQQLNRWVETFRPYSTEGKCATYIPALAEANPEHLGICVASEGGQALKAGEWNVPFTMQSISKAISFMAACSIHGIEQVMERVDVEPTGDAFNSIVRLEAHKPGKPFNPMINAGAITVTSLLPGKNAIEKLEPVIDLLEDILDYRPPLNESVFKSEWETAYLNRSLAYYLKQNGVLASPVEEALEAYSRQCSIQITAEDLAKIGLVLANDGLHPYKGTQVVPRKITKITKALMLTCGTYNASGRLAAFVGVPTKSGVAGGILSAIPPRGRNNGPFSHGCGIGIYGPAIDEVGNSVSGILLLKEMVEQWDLNIF